MYLVDERGVIIDQYGPQYADFDLPIIDGLSAAPGDGGSLIDDGRADLAARVIAAVRSKPAIAKRLSQVDVSDLHNASVILSGDHAVIAARRGSVSARLQSYLDLAPTLRDRVAGHRLRRPALRRPDLRTADEGREAEDDAGTQGALRTQSTVGFAVFAALRSTGGS